MPVKNGDGGIEKLCGESKMSVAVHAVAACFYLLYAVAAMVTPKSAYGHKVASGGCDPKKK
jgi:hypothetical protein